MNKARSRDALATLLVVSLIFWWLFYSVRTETRKTTNLRSEMIASCERVNDLRAETNEAIDALREFLRTAADAREDASVANDSPPDLATAQRYREISNRLEAVDIVDCNEAIGDV